MHDKARTIAETVPAGGPTFYQSYDQEEETARLAYHYEKDPEFFLTLTGGEWHCYSCSMWEDDFGITQAQEKKFDKLAEFMRLEPGMHILDVGFGWGGPLVYMCHKYGVTGHGITISPIQVPTAVDLADKYGVNATFEVVHWQDLPDLETYDAILTDEVMVHIYDLDGFFAKCYKTLKSGGRMVHKELHFTQAALADSTDRLAQHINKIFGYTGNYRTLHEELELLDNNHFKLEHVYEIPLMNYLKTMAVWLKNNFDHRERLKAMTSSEAYKDFRRYLKGTLALLKKPVFGLHIVASSKLG